MLTVIHHPAQLPPGFMIHGWRVVRLLGAGTYGAVYRVERDGQHVAMKLAMHRPSSGDAEQADARLKRELGCLVHLRHANIVGVHAHARWPDLRTGWLYVVLDLVEGYTLAEWVERMHPTAQEVVRVFMKLAGALDFMHGRGVFHRDLKLANIMVRASDGEPVILDFSAGDYTHAEDLTDAPLPPGTRRYRTPEASRFLKEHGDEWDARYEFKVTDDVYALGVCLYDVLTTPEPASGLPRAPVEGRWTPTPARELNARVPAALSDVAMRFIARQPEQRPPTAEVMRRELESLAAEAGSDWTVPVHIPSLKPSMAPASNTDEETPPLRRGRRERRVEALLAVAVVALLAGAFVWLRPVSSPVPIPLQEPFVPPASSPGVASLPSVPTQKESSAVKRAPLVESPPASSERKPPGPSSPRAEFLKKCAAASAVVALQLGCPSSSQVRPKPGTDCPPETVEAMREMWIRRDHSIRIVIDERQPTVDLGHAATFSDGPVVGSVLTDDFKKFPRGTLLYGRLWTTDGNLVGRYTQARLPSGKTRPICMSLNHEGFKGSRPGEVHTTRDGAALIVDRWP